MTISRPTTWPCPPTPGRRERAGGVADDGSDMCGTNLHPKDVPGAMISIDWADPADHWKWAGPEWRDHVRTGLVAETVGPKMTTTRAWRRGGAGRWAALVTSSAWPLDDDRWGLWLDPLRADGRLAVLRAWAGSISGRPTGPGPASETRIAVSASTLFFRLARASR